MPGGGGHKYLRGLAGLQQDAAEGRRWLGRAAEAGDQEAAADLQKLAPEGR